MQWDGNFVFYASDGRVEWTSGTHGNPHSILKMRDDGNLVINSNQVNPIWETQTYSFCPGTT
jgi:hypothetical protein